MRLRIIKMISQSMRHLRLGKTNGRQILGAVAPRQTAVMVGMYQSTNDLLSQYSTSRKLENSLIIGGLAVAASAATLKYALVAYEKYEASKPPPSENTASATEGTGDAASANSTKADTATAKAKEEEQVKPDEKKKKKGDTAGQQAAKKADSIFASWFARNFYDGGFEDKMTKREAALILGIRESATVEKVKEAHRRVLLLNHPDRGGSAFLAAKINEAKDLLLKGRV